MTFETYNQISLALWDVVSTSKKVEKKWGWEFWLENSDKYCAKLLFIEPGFQCSLHYHEIKQETFVVIQGQVIFTETDVRRRPFTEILPPGAKRRVMTGTPHRFGSIDGALILEISTHHSDTDVVRLEESGKILDATALSRSL